MKNQWKKISKKIIEKWMEVRIMIHGHEPHHLSFSNDMKRMKEKKNSKAIEAPLVQSLYIG